MSGQNATLRVNLFVSQYFLEARASLLFGFDARRRNLVLLRRANYRYLRSGIQNRGFRMTSKSIALATLHVRRADESVEVAQVSTVAEATFSSHKPWRRFRSYRGATHYSGNYWCATMAEPVEYESRLELANLIELDFDPHVQWVRAQPFLMSGVDGKRIRRHIPDYLVKFASGEYCVIDVKPAGLLDHPKVRESLTWSRTVIDAVGWEYRILSEPIPARHANIRFLSGYRRPFQFRGAELAAIASVVKQPMTIRAIVAEAAEMVGGAEYARSTLFHLLWTGRLNTDLELPLHDSSILTSAT